MRQLSSRSEKNPLVQRVQRYASMTAIFRSPAAPEAPPTSENRTDCPVADAFIMPPPAATWPPTPQDEVEAFIARQPSPPETRTAPTASPQAVTPPPSSQRTAPLSTPPETGGLSRLKSVMKRVQRAISGEPPVPPETLPNPSETNVVAAEAAAARAGLPRAETPRHHPAEAHPGQPSQTTPPASSQREPAQAKPAPSLPPSQPLTPAERNARRLDTIMRKHREAGHMERQEGVLPAASETAAAKTSVPDLPADAPTKQPASQREAGTTPPLQPSPPPTPEERNARRLDTIMRKHREAGHIMPSPLDEAGSIMRADVPFQPVEQKEEAAPAPPTRADEPTFIQRQPAPAETAVTLQPKPPQVSAVVARDEGRKTAVTPESQPAESTSMPLQSAWPVQVIDTPTPPPVSLPPTAPSRDRIMRQVTPAEDQQVREQLDNIPPSQASESSVQFIRPRKPRPTPPPTPTPAIQREKTADNTPAIAPELSSEETVATEIGDLPSDLWRLIGAEPPPVSQQPAPTTQPQPPTLSPAAKTNDLETPPQQMMTPNTVQSAFISRSEATQTSDEARIVEDITPPTEAPPAPNSEQTEAEPDAAEINMDELARQVYGEIKDRMSIEWERSRGRF
ncbi:MAG: hypothetical protein CSB13_03065 [Chloroflexi bacterium]|nr:MAG: hypothetical protein CSB13_03065 [Chloroflexota bacterium]